MSQNPAHPDRRSLLRGAAALGLGVAGAGALSACGAAAFTGSESSTRRALAAASSGTNSHIDLAQTPKLFWNQRKPASTDSVMQSFTFDQAEKVLYTAQITAPATGDLLLTRFKLGSDNHWAMAGKMSVRFAGHGVSIAAHNGRLWTEADADTEHAGDEGAFGRRLASFEFSEKGVDLRYGVQGAGISRPKAFYLPHDGYDQYTCAVDATNGRLVIRYSLATNREKKYYAVYNMHDALADDWSNPIFGPFRQPSVTDDFQGYTALGNFLYIFTGTAKKEELPPGKKYHRPMLYCYDMAAGRVVQKFPTTAGHRLDHWEPEGMAGYVPSGGRPRLFFGFATGKKHHRTATLYYKDRPTF